MRYYYANAARQPVGPLSDDELTAAARNGRVTAGTPVFAEGSSDWSTYDALFPTSQPERPLGPPPPPPPPQRAAAPVSTYSGAGVDGSARVNEAAQKAAGAITDGITATFRSAKTPAQMMVVFGAIAGVVAFFLPWISGFGDSASGFKLMRSDTFLFALQPLLALGAFVIAFLNLAVSMRQRVLRGRWTLLFGTVPAAVLAGMMVGSSGSRGFGLYIAFLASLAVAAGAFLQMGDDMATVG